MGRSFHLAHSHNPGVAAGGGAMGSDDDGIFLVQKLGLGAKFHAGSTHANKALPWMRLDFSYRSESKKS